MKRRIGLSSASFALLIVLTLAVGTVMGAWIEAEQETPQNLATGNVVAARSAGLALPFQAPDDIVTFANGFRPLVQRALPAVVSVRASRTVHETTFRNNSPFLSPFFRDVFGAGSDFPHEFDLPREREEQGQGPGVIVDPDGYILTNEHVVRDASEVVVHLADEGEYPAEIVGADPKTDIAVLKIDADQLAALPVGDSSAVEVGDFALAIGNPFGLNQTVTMGIVSATGRGGLDIEDYEDLIQTDAAINPGNSGGALINVNGELVGINTAIFSRGGGSQGVGFAIPINMAANVMDQIVGNGRVVRGWLGAMIQPVTPAVARPFDLDEPSGALVGQVTPGNPAEESGLRQGDIILEIDGEAVEDTRELRLTVAMLGPGVEALLSVFRDGNRIEIPVTLGELSEDVDTVDRQLGIESRRGLMEGVSVQDLTVQLRRQFTVNSLVHGVVVAEIRPGTAAHHAGLRDGDVIQQIDRRDVSSVGEYCAAIRRAKDSILLLVHRDGGSMFLVVEP